MQQINIFNKFLECEEYSNIEILQALPLVTDIDPLSFKVEKCNYNSVPLIVGGEPASAGEFPFMVIQLTYLKCSLNFTHPKTLCFTGIVSPNFSRLHKFLVCVGIRLCFFFY